MRSIGFTGTQDGMTQIQKELIRLRAEAVLFSYSDVVFHHGCCIGSDEEFHEILRSLSQEVVIHGHPGDLPAKTSYVVDDCDILDARSPNLMRNGVLVTKSHELWSTPGGFSEEMRSGTWATIRIAKKIKAPMDIIYPDGQITSLNERKPE